MKYPYEGVAREILGSPDMVAHLAQQIQERVDRDVTMRVDTIVHHLKALKNAQIVAFSEGTDMSNVAAAYGRLNTAVLEFTLWFDQWKDS